MNLVSLGATGLQDWVFQRLTAVFITFYILFLVGYCCAQGSMDFLTWQALFHHPLMKLASFIVLISISMHAWLGLWMVVTDYVKPTLLRLMVNSVLMLIIVSYLIWGIAILCRI